MLNLILEILSKHRGFMEHSGRGGRVLRRSTIPPQPTGTLARVLYRFMRLWDEIRLATCRTIRVRYPNGLVVVYDRSEPALTGMVVSSPLFPLVQWFGRRLFRVATLNVTESIEGGETTFAWRGTVGVTSVVIKTDRMFKQSWTERKVIGEWERLTSVLPGDARVASALPIPAYHGLFGEARASIILMSDCGNPVNHFPDLQDGLL